MLRKGGWKPDAMDFRFPAKGLSQIDMLVQHTVRITRMLFKRKSKSLTLDSLNYQALPVLNFAQLEQLLGLSNTLRTIRQLVSLSGDTYLSLYESALRHYAESCQLAPASRAHHHAGPGGLLIHTLSVIEHALRIRRQYSLPLSADPKTISEQSHVWTYAVFCGALLHDAGKLVASVEFESDVGVHSAHTGPLTLTTATNYHLRFLDSEYAVHTRIANSLFHILPPEGRAWLAQYPSILSAVCAWLYGDVFEWDVVGEIVRQADSRSVAENLKLGGDRVRFPTMPTVPVIDRLMRALRQLLADKLLVVNRAKGASGFVVDDDTWLVAGSVVQEIIDLIYREGGTDVPSDRNRIFDLLQDHGFALSNPEGGAIWRIEVSDGNHLHTLTALRMRTRRLFHPSHRPASFTGTVRVLGKDESSESDSTNMVQSRDDEDGSTAPRSTTSMVQSYAESNANSVEQKLNDTSTDSPESKRVGNEDAASPADNARMAQSKELCERPEDGALSGVAATLATMDPSTHPCDGLDDAMIGYHFFAWIVDQVRTRSMTVNDEKSMVHVVDEGVLLVSPRIFYGYIQHFSLAGSQKNQAALGRVQGRFQKLRLHTPAPGGKDVQKYFVTGLERSSSISGWLVGIEHFWPDEEDRPQKNPYFESVLKRINTD